MDVAAQLEFAEIKLRKLRERLPYIPPDLIEQEKYMVAAEIMNVLDPDGLCKAS